MKKLLLTIALVLGATQQTHSMWQGAKKNAQFGWRGAKVTGRVVGGIACLGNALSIDGLNQQIFDSTKQEDYLILNDKQKKQIASLGHRSGLQGRTITPVQKFGASWASLGNPSSKNEHLLFTDCSYSGEDSDGGVILHEMVHMKNRDSATVIKTQQLAFASLGGVLLKKMPIHFKIAAACATWIPSVIHHAYFEDRADEEGPWSLGNKQEVEGLIEFFRHAKIVEYLTPGPILAIATTLNYHPAASYRIKRGEARLKVVNAQEACDRKIQEARFILARSGSNPESGQSRRVQKRIGRLEARKEKLEQEWQDSSTTLSRMVDGFVAHFED